MEADMLQTILKRFGGVVKREDGEGMRDEG
jgi:hypothetical protein